MTGDWLVPLPLPSALDLDIPTAQRLDHLPPVATAAAQVYKRECGARVEERVGQHAHTVAAAQADVGEGFAAIKQVGG